MANNLIDESKAWLPYFYKDGVWESHPEIKYNGRIVKDETIKFMYEFFRFLLDSKFLSNSTHIWLKSNLPSMQKAFEFYNSQCDEIDAVNIKTAITNVDYDKSKLKKYFDKYMLINVITYPDEHLPDAIEKLDLLNRKYMNDKEYKDSLVIKLPTDIISKRISDEKYTALATMLKRYSKKTIKDIESGNSQELTPEMIGYYNYLISGKKLSDVEQERLSEIHNILGIGDNKENDK